MDCISVSFKKAPIDVREKFAWSKREMDKLQNDDVVTGSKYGAVVLSTCNRSEIYYSSDISESEMRDLIKKYKLVTDDMLDDYTDTIKGEKAERHLFEVTSGLDSMVLGEDEVQRQVKEAYQFAHELGKTGIEMNMLFQGAIRCSKKIKAETNIKYLPVSIGTLAANFSADFAKKLDKRAKVLVIGASGKIGKVVTKDLADLDMFDIYCTTRTHHIDLDDEEANHMVNEADYDERYGLIADSDIVISATLSPHCTIYKDKMERNLFDHRKRLLIDLAVPRDIDPEVGEIENVELHDIDFIKAASEENNRKKQEQKVEMERILDEVYDEVKNDIGFSFLLDKYKDSLEERPELKKELYKMRADHSTDEIEAHLKDML